MTSDITNVCDYCLSDMAPHTHHHLDTFRICRDCWDSIPHDAPSDFASGNLTASPSIMLPAQALDVLTAEMQRIRRDTETLAESLRSILDALTTHRR